MRLEKENSFHATVRQECTTRSAVDEVYLMLLLLLLCVLLLLLLFLTM